MGMYDTIHFDKPYECPECGGEICSVQIKEFDKMLNNYRVGDCVGHAEESRIAKRRLYCDNCRQNLEKSVYIVVDRGILLGSTETREEAEKLLTAVNKEKLTLWYHDLYQKCVKEQRDKHMYKNFLRDLREWYGREAPGELKSKFERFRFLRNWRHLKSGDSPVESVENFLTYRKLLEALDKLQEDGRETLEIYYLEEVSEGEEEWAVDILQDELNKRCDTNWTWTVITRKQLEAEDTEEEELPEWNIVVEEPFSEEVVAKAVKKWLWGRRYDFEIKMIAPEEAKGSGILEKLREKGSKLEVSEYESLSRKGDN